MAEAGADIIVAHMGLTTGGAIGAETALKLDRLRGANQRLCGRRQGGEARRDRAVPRRADRDTGRRDFHPRALSRIHGFYGASSMERLPTEVALTETTRRFTQIER